MKLVSMKREAREGLAPEAYSMPNYAGGLCLYLDDDQCEMLGLAKAPKPGTQVSIRAQAVVTTSSASLERDGDDAGPAVSLHLQITDMGVEAAGVLRNAAQVLYGGEN